MPTVRVSDYIVSRLEKEGVDAAFLLSGGGMMHLLDAVGRSSKIRTISQHHEQACGFAAEAYARAKGGLGLCYATSGPGALNTVTAVSTAWLDSTPVLFISGQSKVQHTLQNAQIPGLRQFGTFEADIVPIVQSITKYAAFVQHKDDIRYHLERALYAAMTGRPGPVFLDIPIDIQGAQIEVEKLKGFTPPVNRPVDIDPETWQRITAKLMSAKRPLILAGHGLRAAGLADVFRRFVEHTKIPVITNGMSIDLLPFHHPLLIGHPGVKGDRAGNFALQSCDVLLCLGTSLHPMTTGYEIDQFSPDSFKILVDPDPSVLQKQEVKIDVKVQIDNASFISNFLRNFAADTVDYSAWARHGLALKEKYRVEKEPHRKDEKMNYYEVIEALNETSQEGDFFVTDAGLPFYLMGQAYQPKEGQRLILCGGLGQMGYALPAATGIAVARPNVRLICLTGDGSLQTNIHELATWAYHRLRIRLIVVNNDGYVSIRNTQNNYFNGFLVGTDAGHGVFFPDLAQIAKAYEIPYRKTERRENLHAEMTEFLAGEGPGIFEIFTRSDQDVIPTVTSVRLDSGKMISKPLHEMAPFLPDEATNTAMMRDGR